MLKVIILPLFRKNFEMNSSGTQNKAVFFVRTLLFRWNTNIPFIIIFIIVILHSAIQFCWFYASNSPGGLSLFTLTNRDVCSLRQQT